MTHLITDEALRFMEQHRASPFFLYVPYTTPHFPFQTPEDRDKVWTAENWTEGSRESYVAMLEDMDHSVGRLLDKLQQLQLDEETVVIFGSDHGAMGPGRNLPFRGAKGGLFEGGLRTAMMARWPGKLPSGQVSDRVCLTMDFTYSLARLAGATPLALARLDGVDVLDELVHGRPARPRDVFWRARRGDRTWKAIRSGDWKYIHKVEGGKTEAWLFHLGDDPGEAQNRLTRDATQAERLSETLEAWERAVRP
jgi:N-acetylgalactosamine-6-sulfatase